MKIKTIFIKSFKNLADFTLNLKDDWNVVNQQNGFGKTTITQFVSAMLFGINYRKRDFFEPWNDAGKYGGHLVFEHEGQIFKLERYFGSTAKQEEVNFFNQTLGEKLDATDVGQRLLGLSQESFLQSAFVPQEKIAVTNTSDFNEKLSGMMDANDDGATLEEAIKSLQTYSKKFVFDYGKRGLLVEEKNKLFELECKIGECEKNLQKAEMLTGDIAVLDVESVSLQKEIENLQSERERLVLDYSKSISTTEVPKKQADTKSQHSQKSTICLFALIALAVASVACFFLEQTILSVVCGVASVALLGLFFWFHKVEKASKNPPDNQNQQGESLDFAKMQIEQMTKKLQQLTDSLQQNHFLKGQKQKEAELLFNSNKIAELQSQRIACKNQLEDFTHRLEVAELTMKLLKEAKQNMSEAYLPKLQEMTGKLLKNFSGGRFTSVLIDKEFNINITENHLSKPLDYFSRGIKEITAFCFRIALSTMIFNEIPFLILDDPFVNLDENNFAAAVKMLKKLSKTTQVIYFTCMARGEK